MIKLHFLGTKYTISMSPGTPKRDETERNSNNLDLQFLEQPLEEFLVFYLHFLEKTIIRLEVINN